MTEYVATRWYRAPEIMLSWKQYSFAIDIWATGCILAELLGRMPLFPGKDYMDQLKRTLNYIGKPDGSEISHIRTERARQWVRNFPPTPRVDWRHLYPNADLKSIDLLDRMLQFSPSKRISVQSALKHKYLEQLHDASDEPIANFKFDMKFEQEFKDNTMEVGKSKAVLERELNWFQEFQAQRTNYILHVKSNRSSADQSSHSSSGTPSRTSMESNHSKTNVNDIEEQQRINQFQAHVMRQHMPQINNSNNQNTNVALTQNEIVQRQRMNALQAHMMQQQMMQQQHDINYAAQQQQQQQFEQRTRSQSYPLLPSYQHSMHHSHSFGNNPMHQQQIQHQQGFVNNNQPYMQQHHQQFVQNQQQYQHMQQVQFAANQSSNNDNSVQHKMIHSQSMNLD